MHVEEVAFELFALGEITVGTGGQRRWNRNQFARPAAHVAGVVIVEEFIANPEADVSVADGIQAIEIDDVAFLVHLPKRRNDGASRRTAGQARQIGIPPDSRVLVPVAGLVGVAHGKLGEVGQAQSGLEKCFLSVDREFLVRQGKPLPVWPVEPTASIIPGPKFSVAGAHETGVRVRQADAHGVVVVVVNGATIECKESAFADILFEMEVLESAECADGNSKTLLEPGMIAIDKRAAKTELDPIAVIRFSFGRFRGFGRCGWRIGLAKCWHQG
jgi:hypothetical protein